MWGWREKKGGEKGGFCGELGFFRTQSVERERDRWGIDSCRSQQSA